MKPEPLQSLHLILPLVVTMKIGELLKRLENVKIDEDKRREITDYLAQTFGDEESPFPYYLMTKDKTIYDFDSYRKLLKSNKVSPDDVFVYVETEYFTDHDYYQTGYFYCPFFTDKYLLLYAYLSKLGFESEIYYIVPATELKYVVAVNNFSKINRTVVEVVDIDTAAINTNLQTLIHGVLGTKRSTKYITYDEVVEIMSHFSSQKLFAGYNFCNAGAIIREYYEGHYTSLAGKVEAIRNAYNHIFKPYRIVYDLKTRQFIPT